MSEIPIDLFPAPSPPPSRISPRSFPGSTHQSTTVLRALLKENHEKFHVFFNAMGFHNHMTHYLLALWGLGADSEIIKAAYASESAFQAPAYESPEPITVDNFHNHLGDEKFYNAYLKFFTEAVRSEGIWQTLEKFIFSSEFNYNGPDNTKPEMLNRFLDGLLHPMIHVGYGCEFGLPGMIVEGLASAAVHHDTTTVLLPESMWKSEATSVGTVTSLLSSSLNLGLGTSSPSPSKNVHALTILARVLKDQHLGELVNKDPIGTFTGNVEKHGESLLKYVSQWTFDSSDPKEVERKVEELVWTNVIIYGIGGWSRGKAFNSDFMLMHLVTSSIFLSSITANIKAASQEILLRGYLILSLAWWISRGRPGFDIEGFFNEDTAYPVPQGPFPTPHAQSLPSPVSPKATTPNPWFPIIQTSLVIPDDHIPKLHRALAHFGSLYGNRAPGEPDFAGTELPFAEKLDGSLFIRVAGLANERLRDKDLDISGSKFWDRQGFFL